MISSLAKARENYHIFSLDNTTRSRIISVGIRKYQRPYRRSRAGHNLFYHIHTIVSNWVNQVNASQPTIDQTPGLFSKTVKCIKLDKENKHQDVTCGLLNCQSAGNKLQRIQTEIINNKLNILALTETWFKESNNIIPPEEPAQLDTKSHQYLDPKEVEEELH